MFFQERPKVALEKSALDYAIEYTTIGLVLFSLVYTIIYYGSLPSDIPMHFDHKGEMDSYGSKGSIWILNILSIVTVGGLYYLNRFPHIFNYPQKITEENAKKHYQEVTLMMRLLNLGVALLFSILCFEIINIAIGSSLAFHSASNYNILGIIVAMTVFPLLYVIKNLRSK